MSEKTQERWQVDGKFFRAGKSRVWIHAVTYGPFPGGWPVDYGPDFSQIRAVGVNAVRIYEMPDLRLLDAAAAHGLRVFGGLMWGQTADFFRTPRLLSDAVISLKNGLRDLGQHPALAGVYVGNEIPADLVRWMGPLKVREALERLISLGKELAPDVLFAYANFPSTEYLEPENADFTAFNVYLENEVDFRRYLKRLHHVAGDRPLMISEFGMDSLRNGLARQAEVIGWGVKAAHESEAAGLTIYAWSDRWWNGGGEVVDWDFGLTDRAGMPKPALARMAVPVPPDLGGFFSVIVCTRDGRSRIGACLAAISRMRGGEFETLVVDDGSVDGTADFVAAHFPWVRLLRLSPGGLSAARNAGAAAARGEIFAFTDDDCEPDCEWIERLRVAFQDGRTAAAGGPNLAPAARNWEEAVVSAAPGAPSHVMLDDDEAEHLPGCNLAVTRAAFEEIGGFDVQFQTAGDDVDFCWRLRDAGFRLGFVPGAFVWHWRRATVWKFLRQQLGYGRAEKLLLAKHPERFSKNGGTRWQGFVYGGGPVRVMADSIIYSGPLGEAGFQKITNRTLPLRALGKRFDSAKARWVLRGVAFLLPILRMWERNRWAGLRWRRLRFPGDLPECQEFEIDSREGLDRRDFLAKWVANGWKLAEDTADWDLEKSGCRMQMATERGEGVRKRTLVRVWGEIEEIEPETGKRR